MEARERERAKEIELVLFPSPPLSESLEQAIKATSLPGLLTSFLREKNRLEKSGSSVCQRTLCEEYVGSFFLMSNGIYKH